MHYRFLPALILPLVWSLLPSTISAQQISVADVVVAEEDGQAVFTLTLSEAVPTPVTVNYETTDGTAMAFEDYTATSGAMTFPANVLTRTVSVSIINDIEGELDETFFLNLSGVSTNATIATNAAVATIGESDITSLTWDPGSADFATLAHTGSATAVGRHYFKIIAQTTLRGGWRTVLQVTEGEAHIHASQGGLPTPDAATLSSTRTGSDGWVLSNGNFTAGGVWYVLVDVTSAATWRLYSGDVFVQDMGTLQYTDTNGNSAYTIGEPVLPSGSGPVTIGPEGMRFFSSASPSGTPAWSLWLNGDNRDLAVRQGAVPFHNDGHHDHVQSGAMLLVPDYIDSSFTQFFSVEGTPGESIDLDSRIQSVTDIAFESTQANVNVTAAPFRVYRVEVPIDQIAWDVAVTPHSGNPNICVRRDVVPSEWFNDAMSEVNDGAATDGVTLVPPTLTNGTWFVTVYGAGDHQFTLRNGIPVITDMNYVDTKVNDLTTRAGWRYYALSDIPSQIGSLGWELELAGQVPGTEIAIRRNAVPGRWRSHNGFGQETYSDGWHVDNSRTTGLLQIPGHQADIWYVGIYWPTSPLGAFTLQTSALAQTPVAFAGGSTSVSDQGAGDWRWFRIDVPEGVLGWDLGLGDVVGGSPQMWVRRDLLPDGSIFPWPTFHTQSTWPSGNPVPAGNDWTYRYADADGSPAAPRFVAPMNRPLEPGTYYVGIYSQSNTSYRLESHGIGAGQFYEVTDLAFAADSSATISGLEPREPRYFKVTVPVNTPSWEITLDPDLGEMMLAVRRGYIPVIDANSNTQNGGDLQARVQKIEAERYVILPSSGQDYIEAGDYYLAVVSEGQNPANSNSTGNGPVSGILTSRGSLAVADLGTASATGVGGAVVLEGGQLKAFRFNVPAGTSQLELRLNDRVGQPWMTLNSDLRLPGGSGYYGAEGGRTEVPDYGAGLISIANPAPGDYSLMVSTGFSGGNSQVADPASATLMVQAIGTVPVAFNGGTASVSNQGVGSWKYFRIDVPEGVQGWDLRLTDVTGSNPHLLVRRDLLPDGWFPWDYNQSTWPSGYTVPVGNDWTYRYTNADGSPAPPRFVAAMGRPLEPGTYYVGVHNVDATQSTSYTLESRGIGAGQFYEVADLDFAAGSSAAFSGLEPREPHYFKVTVPVNTPSWEITLDPALGEMMLAVRRGYTPVIGVGGGTQNSGGGLQASVQKIGPERHVILPNYGQDFLEAGEYYLAVISEGQNPANANSTGDGPVSGTLTSRGPLAVADLGTASAAGVGGPVALEVGQLKAFRFNVAAGTNQLELRLNDRVGQPHMSLSTGGRLPGIDYPGATYGGEGGHTEVYDWGTGLISIANPAPGEYSLMVYAGSSATLLVQAVGTVPVAFNGGTVSVSDQGVGSWKYFRIDVPAGVLGWDMRLKDVTGGNPQMWVRRDLLPDGSWFDWPFHNQSTWPSGNTSGFGNDWTFRHSNADGSRAPLRFVAPMGRPLEPGTYFVGVHNIDPTQSSSYTLESRGIGAGQFYEVTNLNFAAGSSAAFSGLEPREPRYFKVTVPVNTPSWEITLDPSLGEMMLAVRRGFVPVIGVGGGTQDSGGSLQASVQKIGAERHVILPTSGQDFLEAGDYYLAVVSEGQNPADASTTGNGPVSGTLTSRGPLVVANLGTASVAGVGGAVVLEGGQLKAFRFNVPAGTSQLELRLNDRVGQPWMNLNSGLRLPGIYQNNDYGAEGGQTELSDSGAGLISIANPAPGDYSLMVYARSYGGQGQADPASASLVVRKKPHVPLNFDAALNGGGGSHTDSRQVVNGERTVYEVQVPANWDGQPLPGWMLNLEVTQGNASMRVFKDWPSTGYSTEMVTINGRWGVIVPPWLTPGTTWHVEVLATGYTEYTLNSRVVAAERAPWLMPMGHNETFGDTGLALGGSPLPGDQGTDLAQGDWHFYAVDVPPGNGGLLRTELQAISGNPDLFIREDGVPTSSHLSDGSTGNSLFHRYLNGSGTEYGNWVPLDGRSEHQLHTGRWYLGVKAEGSSNVRYRLKLSTGSVTDLSLNQPVLPNQTMAAGDWRFYRFAVPEDAPLNWNLTFSQQIGDVVMHVRDTVPPGNGLSTLSSHNAASDFKNQGPYAHDGYGDAGTHGFPLPPLRPGHSYFVGFRAVSDAVFSVSSASSGGTLGTLQDLDYYTGAINTSVPAGGSVLYRIPVPPEATRMKWTATHASGVEMRLEQGTLPSVTGSQHWFSGGSENASFNVSFTDSPWPWRTNMNYYLRIINSSDSTQGVVLNLNGKNAATEDEDMDGLPDAWERQYFGTTAHGDISDPDGDGVTNAVELVDGTNPNDVNSAKYFLTLSPYNGTAEKAPEQPKYDRGTIVTLSDTPSVGHSFLGWKRVGSYADDFVVRITGTVTIPSNGTYTFGTSSAEGLRLKVNDVAVITESTTEFQGDRFGEIALTAGSYPLVLEAFESSDGEALELFAAPGSHASFNSDFKLLGDVANRGLVIQTSSGPDTVPGLAVHQIIGVGTGNIFSLTRMDELLTGTRSKRAETTVIAQTINFVRSGSGEGHFTDDANFPLQQPEATNPFGIGMFGDYILAAMNTIPLADAVDAPEGTFTQAGEAPWLGSLSGLAHDTVDHAVSGPITHRQSTSFSTTVVGPGTLTFRWKVSSQETSDPLQFLVNGSLNQQISGEQTYDLVTYTVPPGEQTLTWSYTKDAAVTSGEDRGWVDQFNYSPARFSLTVETSGGSVEISPQQPDYAAGTVVTLTAVPTGDNSFLGWSGTATGNANPTTVTMDTSKTVSALFGPSVAGALDTPGRSYTLGGDSNWFSQTGTTHDGEDAAESGPLSQGQTSWLESTVEGPGNLRFRWKTEGSEALDVLSFSIDETPALSRSGTGDWEGCLVEIADGSHILRWNFVRGSDVGEATAWLDAVQYEIASEATLTTAAASEVTAAGATLGGEVTDDGGREVTARGVVFATATGPILTNGIVLIADEGGAGAFSVAAIDLDEGTTYFARAYATNNIGTTYGEEIVFTTSTTVMFVEKVAVYSRAILPGGRQVFHFTLTAPRIVSLSTGIGAALRAELYDSDGNLIASFTGDANFDLEEILLAGDYALHVFREEDGGPAQNFELTIDASVAAASRPDVAVGASAGALAGVGLYSPTDQSAALISTKANAVTGHASLANRGKLPDILVGSATGGSTLFAVSYFDPAGNITAELLAGTYKTPEMDESTAPISIRATITPNKKKLTQKKKGKKPRILKKTHVLSLRLTSTFDPAIKDAATIRVQTK